MDDNRWLSFGAYRIDARLLRKRPVARCRIEECRAACCSHGVYVDAADANRIIDEAPLIKPYMVPDQRDEHTWFEQKVIEDSDFPTGYKVGTNVLPRPQIPNRTRCVFLRDDHRCALQAAAIDLGRHPWDLKPFYCALFPLILLGDTLQLDDDNELFSIGGTCQSPCGEPVPLFQTFKEEVILALGQEGYEFLCSQTAGNSGAAQ